MASKIALRLLVWTITTACGAVAAFTAQAASPSKFDLVCTGTNMHIDVGAPNSASYVVDTSPIAMRLSIDLKAQHWCYQNTQCATRLAIASVQGDNLHLLEVKTDSNEASFVVNRTTGAYTRRLYTPRFGQPMVSSGTCIAAPFTPMNQHPPAL